MKLILGRNFSPPITTSLGWRGLMRALTSANINEPVSIVSTDNGATSPFVAHLKHLLTILVWQVLLLVIIPVIDWVWMLLLVMLRAQLGRILVVLVGYEALSCVHVVDSSWWQMVHIILMLVLAGTAAVREGVCTGFDA